MHPIPSAADQEGAWLDSIPQFCGKACCTPTRSIAHRVTRPGPHPPGGHRCTGLRTVQTSAEGPSVG